MTAAASTVCVGNVQVCIDEFRGINKKLDTILADHSLLLRDNSEHHASLYGKEGFPGLVIRTDRIEQRQNRVVWVERTAIAAIFGSAGTWLPSLIHFFTR